LVCRIKITIDSSNVTSDLNNFPYLIHIASNAGLAANARADGYDLVFTSDDEVTKLNHEVEKYVAATGELVAWVKIPFLSSSVDTDIYLYYGNPSATDQSNAAGVWDTNYNGVWHLNEDVADEGSGGTHFDSTSNNNDGSQSGNVETVGRIANGQEFDGEASPNNDAITIGDPANGSLDFGTSSFSYSVWVYVTSSAGQYDMPWFKGGASAATTGYDFELGTGSWDALISDGSTNPAIYLGDESSYLNQWVYLVGVVDRSANLFRAYVNGSPGGTTDITGFGSQFFSNDR